MTPVSRRFVSSSVPKFPRFRVTLRIRMPPFQADGRGLRAEWLSSSFSNGERNIMRTILAVAVLLALCVAVAGGLILRDADASSFVLLMVIAIVGSAFVLLGETPEPDLENARPAEPRCGDEPQRSTLALGDPVDPSVEPPRAVRLEVRYPAKLVDQKVSTLWVILTSRSLPRMPGLEEAASGELPISRRETIRVVPSIPGCDAKPMGRLMRSSDGNAVAMPIAVTPLAAVGRIDGAHIRVYRGQRKIDQVDLSMRVVRPRTWTYIGWAATWIMAIAAIVLQVFGLDAEAQLQVGFIGWIGLWSLACDACRSSLVNLCLSGVLLSGMAVYFVVRSRTRSEQTKFML